MNAMRNKGCRGFSLVELLVVTVIFGLAVIAMYGIYESNRKSSYKQEAVVDVQQNLRVALTRVCRDILMAGFMLPSGKAVKTAGTNTLTIESASSFGMWARIEGKYYSSTPTTPINPFDTDSSTMTFQVAAPEMVDLFKAGDYVRIIRPGDFGQPVQTGSSGTVMTVDSVDRTNVTLTLTGINAVGTIRKGYMIVRVFADDSDGDGDPNTPTPPTYPCTITYSLQDDPNSDDPDMHLLYRTPSDQGDQVLAQNIKSLTFHYILDDGTEVDNLPANDPLLPSIRAVRVTLEGAVDAKKVGVYTGVTTRSLTDVVALRNR
jgi:prepilin-type N-terminal cleavage/methylation domain-containing protein